MAMGVDDDRNWKHNGDSNGMSVKRSEYVGEAHPRHYIQFKRGKGCVLCSLLALGEVGVAGHHQDDEQQDSYTHR